MRNVTLHVRQGDDYIWRVAKATAADEGISLTALVCKAIMLYCTRNNTIVRVDK